MIISKSVIQRALLLCANKVGKWPEDSWFCLGPKWDLNLFQSDGFAKADICPVENGNIKSELAVSLLQFRMDK